MIGCWCGFSCLIETCAFWWGFWRCKSGDGEMSKNEGKKWFWFDVTLICKQVVFLCVLLPCL
nr:MAG TPA: hypothetical protein [Caudoviricetes sp.]